MKPMGWFRSLLFFGIPALIMIFLFWMALPVLDKLGKRLFFVFLITVGGALLALFLASLRFYRKEKSGLDLSTRFRLRPMAPGDWVWAAGLAIVMFAGYRLLSFTTDWIATWVEYPKLFVRLMDPDPNYFMEARVSGNWWVPLGFLAFALANVFGEEFWWRGYILPRQELSFGSKTWILHGIFWTLFHVFIPWNLICDLPGALALAYVAQKRQSTTIPLVAHFAQNVPILIRLFTGVL